MNLDDYSLFYKIRKNGGINHLIGKNGLDFWIAVIITASFLLLFKFNIIDLNWRNRTLSFFNFFIIITPLSITFIGLLYTYRSKFNEDNDFNTWLIKKDVIDELELLIDYPIFLIVTSIIVLIIYGVVLIMFNISNDDMAVLFAIPIFFIMYSYAGFIYAMKTNRYYSHAFNKFKKNRMKQGEEK